MSWDEDLYQETKAACEYNLKKGYKSTHFYINEYHHMMRRENYEAAKAITEVLAEQGIETANS